MKPYRISAIEAAGDDAVRVTFEDAAGNQGPTFEFHQRGQIIVPSKELESFISKELVTPRPIAEAIIAFRAARKVTITR